MRRAPMRDNGDRGGPGRRAGLSHHPGAPRRRHAARGFRDLGDPGRLGRIAAEPGGQRLGFPAAV